MNHEFAPGDRIVSRRCPRGGVMTVTVVDDPGPGMIRWTQSNGRNPAITGFGPVENYEHAERRKEAGLRR